MSKTLKDLTKSGKQRPWRERKLENLTYAEYLDILNFKKANRVKNCAEVLNFVADDTGHLKLYQTWFCKSRLCPMCNWRRSMKQSNQLVKILNEAHKRESHGRFLFLTLTVKNTDGLALKAELAKLGKAIYKLFQYKKVAKNVLGYVRSTEVTVSNDGTYHPHMHVLLFVKNTYFKNSENYINQVEWTKLWQRAMKLDYKPIVNIEAVKANKDLGKGSLVASAQETAKYQVKSKDILTSDRERDLKVVEDLEQALANTRQISFAGIFKIIRKELQLEEKKENLVDLNESEEVPDEVVKTVVAKWNFNKQNYFIW